MRAIVWLPALALVTACSAERTPDAAPTPTATIAAPRTLVAADLDLATLGARVPGMDVVDKAIGDGLARVSAFVACPAGQTVCDPAALPEGTVYTYVLTVTPEVAAVSAEPAASQAEAITPVEAPAELVRMSRPATGFGGAVGFSRAEAASALGPQGSLTVTLDQDRLIWRVTGGTGWAAERPITLWWQSTAAPSAPSATYVLEYGGKRADIAAAFPEPATE